MNSSRRNELTLINVMHKSNCNVFTKDNLLDNNFKNATSQTDLLSVLRNSNFEILSIRNNSKNATIESINQIDLSNVSFVENDSKNATIQQTFCSRQTISPAAFLTTDEIVSAFNSFSVECSSDNQTICFFFFR